MTHGSPAVEALFQRSTADTYARQVGDAAALLARTVRAVERPYSGAGVQDLRTLVDAVDLDRPLGDTAAALREIDSLYLDHAVWFHEPGYVAHLNCPVAIPALVAEVLLSAVNSSVDTWDQSTTGTLIERRLVEWTARRIGFTGQADGVFTSGGTQSNLHGLLLAREDCLSRQVGRDGWIPAARTEAMARMRVLATAESHFSVRTSARLLGLSVDAVVTVPTDPRGRMDPTALATAIERVRAGGDIPLAVVATAGTTDLGCIDPLPDIAALCAGHGTWLHVDAAYGCGLLVSTRRRHLLDGIERADSVTVDFHKSFFQPVSSSALVVRDGTVMRHIAFHADYLNPRHATVPNQVDKSLQTTRRFDALKLWMTLRALGADALGDLFDAVVDLAAQVHTLLRGDEDFEVASRPTLSTLVLRYRPPGATDADVDRITPRLRAALFSEGTTILGGTTLRGRPWLKLTLLNPATTLDDLHAVLDTVRATGDALLHEEGTGAGDTNGTGDGDEYADTNSDGDEYADTNSDGDEYADTNSDGDGAMPALVTR